LVERRLAHCEWPRGPCEFTIAGAEKHSVVVPLCRLPASTAHSLLETSRCKEIEPSWPINLAMPQSSTDVGAT
jgi:hypothetical protein